MMERCATCKWWKAIPEDADIYDRPRLRDDAGREIHTEDYQPVPAPGRWGWCGQVAEFGPTANDKFYVVDGSEYTASLNCREDFGCTEHEAAGQDE